MPSAYVYEDSSIGWRHIASGDVPSGAGSPLTTKGDLYGFDTANNRIPVGANNTVLTADSTQTLGVKWAATSGGTIATITSTGGSITVGTPSGPTTNVDVATSGVSAATYGDNTHVAQFHVGADGRVTSASNVAISGSGGAGGLISLYDSGYLGADAASLDTGAGGIASGHFCLMVVAYLRSTAAVTQDNAIMKLNNDGSSLYNVNRIQNNNTVYAGASVALGAPQTIGNCFGASATVGYFSSLFIFIPAYDGTSNFKAGTSETSLAADSVGNSTHERLGFTYKSASAISRLALTPATGPNFRAGSRMVVYGMQ